MEDVCMVSMIRRYLSEEVDSNQVLGLWEFYRKSRICWYWLSEVSPYAGLLVSNRSPCSTLEEPAFLLFLERKSHLAWETEAQIKILENEYLKSKWIFFHAMCTRMFKSRGYTPSPSMQAFADRRILGLRCQESRDLAYLRQLWTGYLLEVKLCGLMRGLKWRGIDCSSWDVHLVKFDSAEAYRIAAEHFKLKLDPVCHPDAWHVLYYYLCEANDHLTMHTRVKPSPISILSDFIPTLGQTFPVSLPA